MLVAVHTNYTALYGFLYRAKACGDTYVLTTIGLYNNFGFYPIK